jgi:hypothetical protein
LLTQWLMVGCFGIVAARAPSQESQPLAETRPYPRLVTDATRADGEALAALQRPGKTIFADGFEKPDALKSSFEVRGLAALSLDPAPALCV